MQKVFEYVKSKGAVVDVAEIPIYDTLDEARAELGDQVVLDLVNSQNKTNIKNRLRVRQDSLSESKLREMAKDRIICDDTLCEEYRKLSDNELAREALLTKVMEDIRTERRAKQEARIAEYRQRYNIKDADNDEADNDEANGAEEA